MRSGGCRHTCASDRALRASAAIATNGRRTATGHPLRAASGVPRRGARRRRQPARRTGRDRPDARRQGPRLPRHTRRHGQRRRRRDPGARHRERLRRRHDHAGDGLHRRQPRSVPRDHLPRQRGRPAQRGAGVHAPGLRPERRRVRRHRRRGRGGIGEHVLRQPDRRPPRRGQPVGDQPSRSSRSATGSTRPPRSLPLEWTRSDVWYQWQTRPTGQVHTGGALPRPGRSRRRRHGDRRQRLADLLVPRLPERPLLLHRHGPDRRQLRRGQLPNPSARRDPVERGDGPRRLQGHDRRQLPGPSAWSTARAARSPTPASRTASPPPPTAGSSTSAAPTAEPTPSAVR